MQLPPKVLGQVGHSTSKARRAVFIVAGKCVSLRSIPKPCPSSAPSKRVFPQRLRHYCAVPSQSSGRMLSFYDIDTDRVAPTVLGPLGPRSDCPGPRRRIGPVAATAPTHGERNGDNSTRMTAPTMVPERPHGVARRPSQ